MTNCLPRLSSKSHATTYLLLLSHLANKGISAIIESYVVLMDLLLSCPLILFSFFFVSSLYCPQKAPHVSQCRHWDCGVACAQMVLQGLGREVDRSSLLASLRTQSVWTIDLAMLLHRQGVRWVMVVPYCSPRNEEGLGVPRGTLGKCAVACPPAVAACSRMSMLQVVHT